MKRLSVIRSSRSILVAGAALAILGLSVATVLAQSAPAPQRPAQPAVKPKPAAPAAATSTSAAPAPTTQGIASTRATGGDDVIARVGEANISAEELRAYVGALGAREQAALAKDPALLSQAVRMLLANRLVLQEVMAKKWDQQPNVAAQLDRVRENAMVEIYLQSVSTPPESFPSEDELQKVYDANRGALLVPRQFYLAQIFVAANEGDKVAEDKARKSIEAIQAKLRAPGADFGAIAQAESDSKGSGDLGWVAENQIRPEIKAQVQGLAKNAISEAVRLDDGWHIIKLIDTKAAYTRTLPEVRDQLVQQMRSERAAVLRRAYLAELLKQNPPILNELALSSLLDNSRK
ncbi:peptidylprolyl isomerase [Bradyrhizobium sp. CB1717]|uniref:peptidylprolyl isomerase n=1 Tax=Bradyrhizobium sp. CB1717 TaxID=3039154 RepID=UPI0024B073AF|nr:peptidylprolyl isomerase [Bradyrhizobium sp. CB1717]WFU22132.1 peptidylprolyl isomerase [Bradyrhizobium sp. CB1717]